MPQGGFGRRTVLQGGSMLLGGLSLAPAASGAALNPAEIDAAATSPRRRVRLDSGWRFHLGHASDPARDFGFGKDQRTFAKAGTGTTAAMTAFDDSGWAEVAVPHDWAIALPYAPPKVAPTEDEADAAAAHGFRAIGRDFPENSIGWYRRKLDTAKHAWRGRCYLEFDGVFRDALVFVNGYVVARNASGYAPCTIDITDFLNTDGTPDQLALRVDATLGEGWFYEGAGVYRDVHLLQLDETHVAPWGVQVVAEPGNRVARLQVRVDLRHGGPTAVVAELRSRVLDAAGHIVAELPPQRLTLGPGADLTAEATGAIPGPVLWSPRHPMLYRLVSELRVDDRICDTIVTPFGIRSTTFDAERGFLLNGEPLKLLGVCNHHDHAGVGTAVPPALEAWRIARMQEMGANAWRSAHNPPSSSFLDLCDATGMMVIDELRLNTTSAEGLDELDRIVRRDRNHPSIILWSIGNEEPHQGTERGKQISARLAAEMRRRDPTRPVTQAFDSSFDYGAVDAVDVVGFNYRTNQIPAWHQRFPGRSAIATEAGSTVSTRGAYANDAAAHVLRAYDTEHPWWATTAEEWWTIVADAPYIAGGFIWTGFDYHGEPTPFPEWPSVSSYFGVTDLCGFPKDNYHYYRAWWRRDEPLVHLFPHWTWPGKEGQPVEVWVHSNCDAVELFLNGASLGRKPVEPNRHLAWSVPFRPGEISARGWRSGRIVATDRRRTTGKPVELRLTADRQRLAADGRDLAVLAVSAIDARGDAVPIANLPLALTVSGPGRVIGTGNGDPVATAVDGKGFALFNGLAQALVQSDGRAGTIDVRVSSPTLRDAALPLFALQP
jgi:beta-galactosidase